MRHNVNDKRYQTDSIKDNFDFIWLRPVMRPDHHKIPAKRRKSRKPNDGAQARHCLPPFYEGTGYHPHADERIGYIFSSSGPEADKRFIIPG